MRRIDSFSVFAFKKKERLKQGEKKTLHTQSGL